MADTPYKLSRRALSNGSWLALAAMAVVLMACPDSYSPNERSTDDQTRNGAQPMPVRTPVTDAVNYDGGDATDWKRFDVPAAGPMTIEVFFDNRFVKGSVSLYDSYGTELASTSRSSGSDPSVLVYDFPSDGPYYVRIHASENMSVYTVRIFPGTSREDAETLADPRPEFDRPI